MDRWTLASSGNPQDWDILHRTLKCYNSSFNKEHVWFLRSQSFSFFFFALKIKKKTRDLMEFNGICCWNFIYSITCAFWGCDLSMLDFEEKNFGYFFKNSPTNSKSKNQRKRTHNCWWLCWQNNILARLRLYEFIALSDNFIVQMFFKRIPEVSRQREKLYVFLMVL